MSKESFKDHVLSKAKELKVAPKYLLFAIAALAENPDADESIALYPYYRSLVNDMKEQAHRQLNDKSRSRREAAKAALTEANEPVENFVKIFGFLDKNEPVMLLHLKAHNHILSDKAKIAKRFKEARKIDDTFNSFDSIQIIKRVCSELINEFVELKEMFTENDLSFN